MKQNKDGGRKAPELLVPASSLAVLKTAVAFGADAVYIGGEAFSLRAKAKNFTLPEMAEGIAFAHKNGVAVHVTANILAHNYDLEAAKEYFRELADLSPDALIISDPGMIMLAKENCPDIPIHLSTQANNTNYMTYRFWYEQGVKRVVSARELSLTEIRQIRENIPEDMEIESFIHGAICISYSGRCLLSNYFTGRDANRGACTHPCRWKYFITEESRPGEYLPIEETERGTFLFNSGDLCMIEHIPELIDAGINSFKIEGRMKTALYVATVARTYRKAIDAALQGPEAYEKILPWCLEQIGQCTYRKFNTGFYFGRPGPDSQIYDNSTYEQEAVYLGSVETDGETEINPGTEQQNTWGEKLGEEQNGTNQNGTGEKLAGTNNLHSGFVTDEIKMTEGSVIRLTQKNKFCVGDEIEIMKPDGRDLKTRVLRIEDEKGNPQQDAPHAGQSLRVFLNEKADAFDILRKPGSR